MRLNAPLTCNIGSTDKKVRIILGLIIFIVAVSFQTWWFLLGWIPIFTGLTEFCPLYFILGISTTRNKKKFWA